MRQQILVITADLRWQQFIPTALGSGGYQVVTVPGIAEGLAYVYLTQPDLIILDAMAPGRNGAEHFRYFRQVSAAPLLVVMRQSCPDDPIEALKKGADAYLVKPVSKREFQARVKALLRRTPDPGQTNQPKDIYWDGNLMIDFQNRIVEVRGQPVHFSPTEYKLLTCLVQHRDRVLSHQFLVTQGWGPEAIDQTQYLVKYINSLRQKIEPDADQPSFIKTQRGVGYRFDSTTTR